MAQEIQRKNQEYRGFDTDRLVYYCGQKEWKVNPEGHTRPVRQQLIQIITKYEETMVAVDAGKLLEAERTKVHESTTRAILKIGLVNFDYEQEAGAKDVGEAVCHKIANDVYSFLAVTGGWDEYKLLQTRLRQIIQNT